MSIADVEHELTMGPVTAESLVQRLQARGIPTEGAVNQLSALVLSGKINCKQAVGKTWFSLKGEPAWEPEGTTPTVATRLSTAPERKTDWKAAVQAVEDHAVGRVGEHLAFEALERHLPGFEVIGFKPHAPSNFKLNPYSESKQRPSFDLELEILFVLENTDLLAPTAVTIMHRVTAMKGLRPFELNYADVLSALRKLKAEKKVGTLAPDDRQGTGWFKMRDR